MAVKRSQNWINQQRIDAPHLRSVESAVRNDFDQLFTALVLGETESYVIRGFEIEMAGSIGASSSGLQMIVADSSVLHGKSDEAGTFFNVASGTSNQVLSATTNTRIDGAFTPSSLNYVSVEFVRQVDDSTSSQVFLWNPTTSNEITKNLPLAETLDYKIVISSSIFASNVLPIAIVQTDSSNNVLLVEDRRPMLFGTGTAGASTPDPFNEYQWTDGRTPNFWSSSSSSISPFEGGDKQIETFKDNDLAIKTEIKLIKGTQYWSSPNIGGSIAGLRYDLGNTIMTGRGSISHDAGNAGLINWDLDVFLTVLSTRLKYKLEANAATTDIDLADKEVAYIKIIRNVDITPQLIFTNGSAVVSSVGAVSWTTGLEAGDFVKVASEEDTAYYQILTVDSVSQVTLTENFGGTSTGINGTDAKYAFGNYRTDPTPSTDRHIKTAAVEDMPFDADTFWLFFRDDNSGISRIYLRFLNAELKQGETITIADQVPAAVLAYMGSSSDADADPNYATLATGAKTGTENYNAVQGENLTIRSSKLTSMIADKAQDKTIELVSDHTNVVNTTNVAAQEITMSGGSGTATVIMPGSTNNGTIGTTGTLSLNINQAAYYIVDRNAVFSVANLAALTVADIDSIPHDENTFIFAYRLAGTTVHLWNGQVLGTGTSISLSVLRGYVQQNKTTTLVRGGTWSWDLATTTLANSASAFLQVAGLAENVNEIIAQSIVLTNDGDCAYVTLKRVAGVSTLTVNTAPIASVPVDDDTFIIARRTGSTVVLNDVELSTIINANQDRNLKLIDGGTWNWDLATTTLSWSANAHVQIPGLADTVNVISAGSAVLDVDGKVAHVSVNRDAPGGTISVSITAIASVVIDNDEVIIARRVGNDVIVGTSSFAMKDGEFLELDGALSEINRYHGQAQATPEDTISKRIKISGSDIAKLSGSQLSLTQNNLILDFPGVVINFDTGEVFETDGSTAFLGGANDFTPFVIGANQYFYYSVAIIPGAVGSDNKTIGNIVVTPAASSNAVLASAPQASFPSSSIGVCSVYVQEDGAASILNIDYANIVALSASGGGGGAGGGGGLDTFHTQTFEETAVADFTSGLNAVYKTAGTFGGTLADETSTPIAGDSSPKYTAGVTSTNDWFDVETITLDDKQKNLDIGINFWADTTGYTKDAEFVVWDNTNSVKLDTTGLHVIEADTARTRYSFSVFVPSTTASISYGFHMVDAPVSTESFKFDDFEFSTNPFVFKNLLDRQEYRIEQAVNSMTNTTNEAEFNLGTATITDSGNNIISAVDDSANTRTKFIANRKCTVTVDFSSNCTINQPLAVTKNGTEMFVGSDASSGSIGQANGTMELDVGEFFTFGNVSTSFTFSGGVLFAGGDAKLSFVALAETEHLITPINNSESYIRIMDGNGHGSTNTKIQRYSTVIDNVGTAITYADSATDGASFTINEAGLYHCSISGIAEPVGFSLNSSQLTTNFNTITSTDALITEQPAAAARSSAGGTFFFNVGDVIRPHDSGNANTNARLHVAIAKIGFKSLAATPIQKTAYLKDVKAANTAGGTFTSGAWRTRTLNTIEGDSSIVSLSSDQFTLGAGVYEIEINCPAYLCVRHKAKLVEDPSGTPSDAIIGSSAYSDNSLGGDSVTESIIKGNITITSSVTYEVQHQCGVTKATDGFGIASNFGVSELYTQVKITKIA